MADMINIMTEVLPCWYELSFLEKHKTLVFKINQDFIKELPKLTAKNRYVKAFMDEFKFDNFGGSFDCNLGFEGAFQRAGGNKDFVEFVIDMPKVRRETGEICKKCSGREDEVRFCFDCSGTGKVIEYNYKAAYAISASFTLLLGLAEYPEKRTRAKEPQLLTVTTITDRGNHGGSLQGNYGIVFCNWLDEQKPNHELKEVKASMAKAYSEMMGEISRLDPHGFLAYMQDKGRVTLKVPGDASDLFVEANTIIENNRGREFYSHNIDTPVQQITLLVGLAKLCDLARKSKISLKD